MYGGFPEAFLNRNYWVQWMNNYVKTYFERDLPNLGFPADSITGEDYGPCWHIIMGILSIMLNWEEVLS